MRIRPNSDSAKDRISDSPVVYVGAKFRIGEAVDSSGSRMLVFQAKGEGAYHTVATLTVSGELYLKGTLHESTDFAASGWDFSRL